MFADTGKLSLYLGGAFIILALVGFAIAAFKIRNSDVEGSKTQAIIDLGKWMLTSVAIVVGASIVSDAFKEREQDVKEFTVFDKYVDTVTQADNPEKWALLANYFSIVAPKGELRESWKDYKKYVDDTITVYRANKLESQVKLALPNPTAADLERIAQLEASISSLEQSFLPPPNAVVTSPSSVTPVDPVIAAPVGSWLVVASSDENLEEGQFELAKARKVSPAAQIYKKGNLFLTVIPAFKTRADANARLAQIRSVVNKDAFVFDADKLCPKLDVAKGYLVCG